MNNSMEKTEYIDLKENSHWRDWKNKIFFGTVVFLSFVTISPIILITYKLLVKGLRQINFDFFVRISGKQICQYNQEPDRYFAGCSINCTWNYLIHLDRKRRHQRVFSSCRKCCTCNYDATPHHSFDRGNDENDPHKY